MASTGVVTIDNTLGALLVGFALSCCIYGILVTQIYVYFSRYGADRPIYKFLVVFILLLETTDQAFIGHIVYYYTIVNFGKIIALIRSTVTWSFILQQAFGSTVGAIVKTGFALRVWRFSQRNYFITALILLLTWGQLGIALAFTVKAFALPDVFAVVQLRVLGSVALGVGVFTDMVTAVSLCYYLNKLRTGYHQSDSLVNSLVRYAINTGMLTSLVSLATLVLYNLMPGNLIFIACYFILSKLYAISYMATLNTRRIVRGKGTDKQGTTSNNTNMFHLGTRAPSMGPHEMEDWSPVGKSPNSAYPPMPAPAFPPPKNIYYAV